MSFLSIQNISFGYKKNQIINNFSLEVEKGSFTTILGSSGCGKTTLLKLISGFLEPEKGEIFINGNLMNNVLPNKRKIGMVFQDYALFPHMTVEQNLMYGLKLAEKKAKTEEMKVQILQTAEALGIEEFLDRYPSELSGGQQQRVALGRSLVLKPDVLLMDEPLSSLDTRLRIKVREELRELQKKLGITTIYVTHDQEEALSLSDKIAVLSEGNLIQYGTAHEIYFEPKNRFVADFVGRANFINLKIDDGLNNPSGDCVKEVMTRPEWIELTKNMDEGDFNGKIISREFLGATIRYKIQLNESELNSNKMIVCDKSSFEERELLEGEECGIKIRKYKQIL